MKNIKRYCKTLLLKDKPELIEEYIDVHRPEKIWPEVIAGICGIGIFEMEIYLTGNRLFMIMDTDPGFNHDRDMKDISSLPRQAEWEDYVGKFQDVYPGNQAGEKWVLMEKVFGLDEKPYRPEIEGQSKLSFPEFKRFCNTIKLKAGDDLIAEYKKYHLPGGVWPEILRGIREVGILDEEIYLKDRELFLILDTAPEFNYNEAMKDLADKPRKVEWEALMSKYQESAPDQSAGSKWTVCQRIFKLTDCIECE